MYCTLFAICEKKSQCAKVAIRFGRFIRWYQFRLFALHQKPNLQRLEGIADDFFGLSSVGSDLFNRSEYEVMPALSLVTEFGKCASAHASDLDVKRPNDFGGVFGPTAKSGAEVVLMSWTCRNGVVSFGRIIAGIRTPVEKCLCM